MQQKQGFVGVGELSCNLFSYITDHKSYRSQAHFFSKKRRRNVKCKGTPSRNVVVCASKRPIAHPIVSVNV